MSDCGSRIYCGLRSSESYVVSGMSRTVVVFAVLGVLWMPAGAGQRGGPDDASRLLIGAIDIHVHSDPDNVPRSLDGLEAARLARSKGMRGIVLKNHYDPTAGLAFLARKENPGLEVFGGIDLNLPVGGMNPAAVDHLTQVAGGWGRLVWMSTFDAENQVRYSKQNRPFVSVSKNGQLLPETKAVIAVIARHRLVLATGHVSKEEGLMMLREGHQQGVVHMVVTHAMNDPVLMDVPQMQEAKMKEGRGVGLQIVFTEGEQNIAEPEKRSLQRPRVFYRRELEANPLVIAKP